MHRRLDMYILINGEKRDLFLPDKIEENLENLLKKFETEIAKEDPKNLNQMINTIMHDRLKQDGFIEEEREIVMEYFFMS